MTVWTPALVEERLAEAAFVLKRLPAPRRQGYFGTWPAILHSFADKVGQEPRPMRVLPSPQAISRMEETLAWTACLEPMDGRIVWMKAHGERWKEICWAAGLQRSAAHQHWQFGLSVIALADNKLTELGIWDEALLSAELNDLLAEDFDLSLVGFSDGELDKLLAFVPEGDGQEGGAGGSVPPVTIPEPPRNPASRTGDLWILGDHRLLCGDSTSAADVRRLMNGERAILFATDPPYLVDYDGSNHPTRNKDWSASYGTTWDDSSQGAELYDGFIAAAVSEAIAENAAWYCWHASRRQAMLEACWEKAGAFVHQQIIWVKDRGVLTRSHYLWKHEPCFMGWRRPNRPPKVAEETLPSTWALPSFAKDDRPDHPTPKPLDAFGIPMRQHVARGGLCYEPFSGSGSQITAGEANGRRVFAMEISPAYIDVAVERWQAETGKDAILDGDGRTFAQVRTERLGDDAEPPADTPDTDAAPEPARKRKTAA